MNTILKDVDYFRYVAMFHNTNLRVGVFGGSFNPPHEGHLHVIKLAKQFANLDIVFIMITPLNPLKNADNLLSLMQRIKLSKQLIGHRYDVKVIAIESSLNKNYSYQTLDFLKQLMGNNQLFWIMGDDNLVNLQLFKSFQQFVVENNFIVIARDRSSYQTLINNVHYLYDNKLTVCDYYKSANWHANHGMYFCLLQKHPLSSTLIRQKDTV